MSDSDVTDSRQARTRKAIRETFMALLFERKYEAVTLVDVAVRANVGRSTLYEHFRTKADLLRDSLEPIMAALANVLHLTSRALVRAVFRDAVMPGFARLRDVEIVGSRLTAKGAWETE